MALLEINSLSKQYKNIKALDNVSFNVEKGEICGLLGPNGAGKTTLLRIINYLLLSDSGTVLINGEKASLEAGRNIGYMPEERGLYEKMRVCDQIMYFGELKGGNKKRLREVMKEYMEIFNLTGQENRKIKELSKGNQQKVQIISTLVHEPSLVILDEPFSGFDPINGALLKDLINRLQEKGTTIMLSSHNMNAIEEMASSIALINKGKLLLRDDITEVKEKYNADNILFTTRKPIHIPLFKESNLIKEIKSIDVHKGRKGYSYKIKKNEGVKNTDILDAISMQGEIIHFEEYLPTLNDIFLNITTGANI